MSGCFPVAPEGIRPAPVAVAQGNWLPLTDLRNCKSKFILQALVVICYSSNQKPISTILGYISIISIFLPRETGHSFLHWSAVSLLILFLRVSTLSNCHGVIDMISMPCPRIRSFKLYTSMVVSIVTGRYFHHHSQVHNTSVTSKINEYPLAHIHMSVHSGSRAYSKQCRVLCWSAWNRVGATWRGERSLWDLQKPGKASWRWWFSQDGKV